MIKIGTAGIPLGCKTTLDAPKFLASVGLNAIEIEFVRSIYLNEESAKKVCIEAKKYNIGISVHAPYFINLNSKNPAVIQNSKNILVRCLKICDCLEANVLVVHTAYYSDKSKEETFDNVKTHIKDILNKAQSKTLFGVEVMGKQTQFGSLEEVLKLCSQIKQTAPIVDFAHIHARGNGCLNTKKDFENVLQTCKTYGFEKLHCHYSGILFKDGNEKKHLEIESKSPDYNLLAEVLNEEKHNITFICESPSPLKDAVWFKNILNKS